eukprot:evm.model.NODE_31921_length_33497_cov_50.621609.6
MKSYRQSLDQVHAKMDTLLRLTESDEGLVDEPSAVEEESQPHAMDTEVEDVLVFQTISESEEEEEEDEEEDQENMPRVEELPPPAPIPTKKPRRKS